MFRSSLFQTYKPVLVFIVKFGGFYMIFSGIYFWYLSLYTAQTDPLTLWVGKIVTKLFDLSGIQAETLPLFNEHGLKLIVEGNYVARIVEGCTAMSVLIMFAAFVFAFGHSFQKNLIFVLGGSILLFGFNILRIVLLGYIMYVFPEYQDMAHRLVFPALIYGFLILLWVVFVLKINDDEV